MSNPDVKQRHPILNFTNLGITAVVAIGGLVLAGCESPISVEDDVSATLPIADETHHPYWLQMMYCGKGCFMPIHHPAYDTFTFNIEGTQQTIRVPADVAARYEPGDRLDVTYDRQHYKNGQVYITDVKLK